MRPDADEKKDTETITIETKDYANTAVFLRKKEKHSALREGEKQ